MKDQDDIKYIVIERRESGVSTFLGGVLIGAVAALLLAPRSGREVRKDLVESAKRVRDTAEDTLRQVQERVTEAMDDVRREVNERVHSARDALEAGRSAARQTRAEMEERIRNAKAGFHAAVDAVRETETEGDSVESEPAAG